MPELQGHYESEPEQNAQTAKRKTGMQCRFCRYHLWRCYGSIGNIIYSLKTHQRGKKSYYSILNGPDERYKAGFIMLTRNPEKQEQQIAHMKAGESAS